MARINKKLWQGDYPGRQPLGPIAVLAQHTDWQRGQLHKHRATGRYPEPINLTGASAWRELPRDNLEATAIIYRCTQSDLWIKVVAVNEVPVTKLPDWTQQQFDQGAELVWINLYAEPARQQPTLNDLDTEPGTQNKGLDPVSLTVKLQQMGKYKIGDYDIVSVAPNKFRYQDVTDMSKLKRPSKKRGTYKGKGSGNCKPIETPDGVFASATIAAEHYGVSVPWITMRARKNKHGYRYITDMEYLRFTGVNTDTTQ